MLISTDENGSAVRVVVENTENTSLFEIMKELMVNLARLNWESTKYVFEDRFDRIVIFPNKRWTTPSSPSRT